MTLSMTTLKQLLREFWLPLLVAVGWTSYAVWGNPLSLKTVITTFGPAFFLASWMTGQFFRVRKQESVQTGFSSLESRLESLVGQLETQAREITHYTTGGDSYCYFGIGVDDSNNISTWTVVHQGKYPLYGVTARIVDLAKFQTAIQGGNPFDSDTIVHVGDIAPNQASMKCSIDLGTGMSRDFNVFYSARNGFFTQIVRFRRINGKWCQATTVTATASADVQLFSRVDNAYPVDANGKPDGI